ncbi:MAG: autotransporter outer membrane beta-barrel domain-containing protein, partial [Pseudomonas sp.]|uniref:autotransporter outer membrane beta-barrel domain-containing protein n=1 Tax=Pseudomonas sp. TaxID=306 RepID=UPI003C732E48
VVPAGSALDTYDLRSGSGLTVQGAVTNEITAQTATLILNPNSQTKAIIANNSTLTINGSRVTSTAPNDAAIRLSGSRLTLGNSQIINTNGVGLAAGRPLGSINGSTVTATNSQITGVTQGARASAFSVLDFNNTRVEATGANGAGVLLQNGQLRTSNNTSIIGGRNGIMFDIDNSATLGNSVVLNASSVEGKSGSAILVTDRTGVGINSDIQVLNGSTLKAGNGILLDVQKNSTANMSVDNSTLVGDVVVEAGSTANVQLNNNASLTGQLNNVAQLDVNSNAQWVLVGDSQVNALKMGGGTVVFGSPAQYFQLNTSSLTGDGTFAMHTNFNTGETDLLNVVGNAEGNHKLLIAASGSELATGEAIKVVHTESGGARFGLVGDTVDVGAFEYGLKQKGTDWFLDTEKQGTSTSAKAVLALANAAPAVLVGESSVLRTRMGEVRFGDGKSQGLWIRGYGNKIDVAANSNGVGYSQNQNGVTIGFDNTLNDEWTLGVLGGYSNSTLGLSRGSSGMVNSYYLGTYAIWKDDSGTYVDLVGKVNRLNGQSQVNMSDGQRAKGNYTQDAVSASVEVGHNFKLNDEGLYVEPFAYASVASIGGSNYTMDNGLKAKSDRATSAIGKVGVTLGNDIQLDSGAILQPYVRTAVARDFSPDNKVYINDQMFKNNLSGASLEVAGGMAVSLSKNLSLHAEVNHSQGKAYDMPWGATAGVQYSF